MIWKWMVGQRQVSWYMEYSCKFFTTLLLRPLYAFEYLDSLLLAQSLNFLI